MDAIQWINAFIVLIGVPSIAVGLVFVGRKLEVLDSLETSCAGIKHNLKVIGDYLTRHHATFDPSELHALSPLQLTPQGRQFLEELDFDNVVAANKTDFFACIDEEHPKLKYDVETAAIKSIYTLTEKPYMQFLKVFFYNNPERSLENTAATLGVYIRDLYLAEHPEITQ
ncbi:hypothetical protein HY734_01650 [Candidatus Uhrbacteria bacterium]|nr:hypothetical protein [Candidatus Uhrbacteria bacterium]